MEQQKINEILQNDNKRIFESMNDMIKKYNELRDYVNNHTEVISLNNAILTNIVIYLQMLFKAHLPGSIIKSQEFQAIEQLIVILSSHEVQPKKALFQNEETEAENIVSIESRKGRKSAS